MSATTTTAELRKMPLADLQKEIRQLEDQVAKQRLGVRMGSEKNSAKYVRERKALARMKTILTEKHIEQLSESKSDTTVAAPEKSSSSKN